MTRLCGFLPAGFNAGRLGLCQLRKTEPVSQFVVPQSGMLVKLKGEAAPALEVDEKVHVFPDGPPAHPVDPIQIDRSLVPSAQRPTDEANAVGIKLGSSEPEKLAGKGTARRQDGSSGHRKAAG